MTTRKTRESNASRSADTTTGKDTGIDFEKALSDLEAIVERLEQGDLPLEESLKAFERGVELTRHCQTALKQAEQKVEILLRKTGQAEEFEPGTARDAPADD